MSHLIELREGGVVRASRVWTPDGTRISLTLTPEEKAAVVNWLDAEWWLTADGGTQAVRVTRMKGFFRVPSVLTVELWEGATLIATREVEPLDPWTGESTRWEILLTPEEKAAVVTWGNVQVWLTPVGGRAIRVTRLMPVLVQLPYLTVSGTALAGLTEADLIAGGKTIVLTLHNAQWIAA